MFGLACALYHCVKSSNQNPFRITVEDSPAELTVRLAGKIMGSSAQELSRTWVALAPSVGKRRVVIDLSEVLFMDAAGVAAMADIYDTTKAVFQADTPLMKYFAEEAMSTERNSRALRGDS
jgi:anti-anti-sigma factor